MPVLTFTSPKIWTRVVEGEKKARFDGVDVYRFRLTEQGLANGHLARDNFDVDSDISVLWSMEADYGMIPLHGLLMDQDSCVHRLGCFSIIDVESGKCKKRLKTTSLCLSFKREDVRD
jgi:hypothetical protein